MEMREKMNFLNEAAALYVPSEASRRMHRDAQAMIGCVTSRPGGYGLQGNRHLADRDTGSETAPTGTLQGAPLKYNERAS